jgi:hypothetical protein
MRCDLRELHVMCDDIAQLQLLSSYRADVTADRTRTINRLAVSSPASSLPWSESWTSPTATR